MAKKYSELSQVAKNNLDITKGNAPSTVKKWINGLSSSVVKELKDFTDSPSIDELCVKLSGAMYSKD